MTIGDEGLDKLCRDAVWSDEACFEEDGRMDTCRAQHIRDFFEGCRGDIREDQEHCIKRQADILILLRQKKFIEFAKGHHLFSRRFKVGQVLHQCIRHGSFITSGTKDGVAKLFLSRNEGVEEVSLHLRRRVPLLPLEEEPCPPLVSREGARLLFDGKEGYVAAQY